MDAFMAHRPSAVLVIAGVAVAALAATGEETAPGRDTIAANELRRDVFQLASDEMGGRLVGTAGNRLAAEFIAQRFDALGLIPIGDEGGYFHNFDLVVASLGRSNGFEAHVGSSNVRAELGDDFYPERFSGSGRARGSLAFVGFGISAPSLDHDDYGTFDVSDRVVVVLDHEPGETEKDSVFDGLFRSEHARGVRKALEAQRRGASAVLFVSDLHNHSVPSSVQGEMDEVWSPRLPRIPPYQLGAWVSDIRISAVRISVDLAKRLFGGGGLSLVELSEMAEADGGMSPVERTDVFVEVTATVERELVPEKNVVGLIEGADPELRDEWVVLCAHYDHEGTTDRGIFRGADDDASGVAGLLEIAEAYARASDRGKRPRRSILFAAWNAEELGLLGAWAYTARPLRDLDDTVAVINLDMIGRHEEIPENAGSRFRGLTPQTADSNRNAVNLLGYSYSTDLRRAVVAANLETALDLRFRYDDNRSNLLRRSDHWPFLFSGVPAVFVHTGLHPDYHTERDEADKLDYAKMTRVVGLAHQLSWDLAQSDSRPALN